MSKVMAGRAKLLLFRFKNKDVGRNYLVLFSGSWKMMVLFSTNPSTWSLPKLTGYGVEIKSAARVKMEGGAGGFGVGKIGR